MLHSRESVPCVGVIISRQCQLERPLWILLIFVRWLKQCQSCSCGTPYSAHDFRCDELCPLVLLRYAGIWCFVVKDLSLVRFHLSCIASVWRSDEWVRLSLLTWLAFPAWRVARSLARPTGIGVAFSYRKNKEPMFFKCECSVHRIGRRKNHEADQHVIVSIMVSSQLGKVDGLLGLWHYWEWHSLIV